jgi:hypothetical protein
MRQHQPSFYLTDEAAALRLTALVMRLADNPDSPDYERVPPRIRYLVRNEIALREHGRKAA